MPLISELTQSEEGELLLAMLVDDFYQALLHAADAAPRRGSASAALRAHG
ncbi:MAG: hypothetical protein R3A10_07795 [Caldilineaceae bacterium]